MIKLKDLQNRVYNGRDCVRFEYAIMVGDKYVYAQYRKGDNCHITGEEWNMQLVFGRTRDKDSDVYNFGYVMPKSGMPLELIAATGLKYLQLYIKQEVQMKSSLDFEIGRIVEGM